MNRYTQRTPRLRTGMLHSLWVTGSWNWFLELMGRAAEAILVLSVLYASVKLLPVVHLPESLDVTVFIAQFVALDVGGLSLSKLAEQAEAAHNERGATHARWMSRALLSVLIAGVVVVALEQLFVIPASGKLAIETMLLIARSILAVFYGQIIHRLKLEDAFGPSSRFAFVVFEEVIGSHIEEMTVWQTDMEHHLSELAEELQQQVLVIQHESEASLAARDDQLRHEFAQLETRLQAALKQQSLISADLETHVTKAPASRPSTPGRERARQAHLSLSAAARASLAATDNETTEQSAPDG